MAKLFFMDIANFIFENKSKYSIVDDQDKIDAFYKINQKFFLGDKDFASSFNSKFIDKASAIDLWFDKLKNISKIPGWYWASKKREETAKKNDTKMKQDDKDIIMKYVDLSNSDIDFLYTYYPEDLKKELKKAKKFYGE